MPFTIVASDEIKTEKWLNWFDAAGRVEDVTKFYNSMSIHEDNFDRVGVALRNYQVSLIAEVSALWTK